jgi:hypothetical protein
VLGRVDPDHHHQLLVPSSTTVGGQDGQTYLERSRPLLSHIPPRRRPAARNPFMSHTVLVGKRFESSPPAV